MMTTPYGDWNCGVFIGCVLTRRSTVDPFGSNSSIAIYVLFWFNSASYHSMYTLLGMHSHSMDVW